MPLSDPRKSNGNRRIEVAIMVGLLALLLAYLVYFILELQ